MGDEREAQVRKDAGKARKPQPASQPSTAIDIQGAPAIGNSATQRQLASLQGGGPVYLPDARERAGQHLASLNDFTGVDNTKTITTRTSSTPAPGGQVHRELHTDVSATDERGSVDERETFLFSVEPPQDLLVRPLEMPRQPPLPGQTYPVNLIFSRSVSYADRKGRLVRADIEVSLGMSMDTYQKAAPTLGAAPRWEQLRNIPADVATAWITLDGSSLMGKPYFGYVSSEAQNASFNAVVAALNPPVNGSEAPLPVQPLIDDTTGAGLHFNVITGWLDTIDEQRAEAARVHHAWWSRPFYAMAGAVSAFGNMFVEAGRQVWDMGRLGIAALGRWRGWWEYEPKMTSQIGKAAEQGKDTGDILEDMGKGIIETPHRIKEAMANDDPFAFGEEAFNAYMIADSAVSGVKGGWNLAQRGAQWLRAPGAASAALGEAGVGRALPAGAEQPLSVAPPEADLAQSAGARGAPAPGPGGTPAAPEGAQVGDIGRHSGQGARGANLISEHLTLGQLFRELLGDQYNEAHYLQDITFVWEREAAVAKTSGGPMGDMARLRDVQARLARGEPVDVTDEFIKALDETLRVRESFGSRATAEQVTRAGLEQWGEKFDIAPGKNPGWRMRRLEAVRRAAEELRDPNTPPARRTQLRNRIASMTRDRLAELRATGARVGAQSIEAFDERAWDATFSAEGEGPIVPYREYPIGPSAPADQPLAPSSPTTEPVIGEPQLAAPTVPHTVTPPSAPVAAADPVQAALNRGGIYRALASLGGVGPRVIRTLNAQPAPIDPAQAITIVRSVGELQVVARVGRVIGALANTGRPIDLASVPDEPYWVVFQRDDGSLALVSDALLRAGRADTSASAMKARGR
jgi:hypothetical protein